MGGGGGHSCVQRHANTLIQASSVQNVRTACSFHEPEWSRWKLLIPPLKSTAVIEGRCAIQRWRRGGIYARFKPLEKRKKKKKPKKNNSDTGSAKIERVITSKAFYDTSCSQSHIAILPWHAVRAEEYLGVSAAHFLFFRLVCGVALRTSSFYFRVEGFFKDLGGFTKSHAGI